MIKLAIETTSRCNLQCSMCGHPTLTRPKQDMDFDLFTRIISDVRRNKYFIHQMHLMGEPLMDRLFERRIEHLAKHDIKVRNSFSTNCVLLTPERTDALIDAGFRRVHSDTQKVRLCIDSMDRAVYDELRVGGNHELVIENAKYFISKMRGKVRNILVQRLITDKNPDEPEAAFAEFGVGIRTQKVGLHHDKSRDFRCVKDRSDRRGTCRLLFNSLMWVTSDGRVTGCCLDCDCLQPFGDLKVQTIAKTCRVRNIQRVQFRAKDYSALPQCDKCYGNDCIGRW